MTLVDLNPAMLHSAEAELNAVMIHAPAEETTLPTGSVDGILIGSAVHWMNRETLVDEIQRILKPMRPVFIFEYQFPVFKKYPELNQWIKNQFNTRWRAPSQTPRGTFEELLGPFFKNPAFELKKNPTLPMVLPMTLPQLAGFLFSQSRYQHHELTISEEQRLGERQRILQQMTTLVGPIREEKPLLGDFRLDFRTFVLKNPI